MGIIFKAEELTKDYYLTNNDSEERNEAIHVLQGMDFQIEENAYVAFMGKSGCGKTTLLKILGLIEKQTNGKLYYKDKNIGDMSENDRTVIRRQQLGFVFQDYYLMNSLSVEENIVLPMLIDKACATDSIKRAKKFEEILEIGRLAKKRPYELSGGEKQRVAIARALAADSKIIVADEPTGNLDDKNSEEIYSIFDKLAKKDGKIVIIVSHDKDLAKKADCQYEMRDGKLNLV